MRRIPSLSFPGMACSQPDEYEKLGSYALIGLPDDQYPIRCACADTNNNEDPTMSSAHAHQGPCHMDWP